MVILKILALRYSSSSCYFIRYIQVGFVVGGGLSSFTPILGYVRIFFCIVLLYTSSVSFFVCLFSGLVVLVVLFDFIGQFRQLLSCLNLISKKFLLKVPPFLFLNVPVVQISLGIRVTILSFLCVYTW